MGSVFLAAIMLAVNWLLRYVVFTAVVSGCIYAALTLLLPFVWSHVSAYIVPASLTTLFGGIPDSVYWGLYAFKFDVGLPLVIGAYVSRFLIRRLPVVG